MKTAHKIITALLAVGPSFALGGPGDSGGGHVVHTGSGKSDLLDAYMTERTLIPSAKMEGYALALSRLDVWIKSQDSVLSLIAERVKDALSVLRWDVSDKPCKTIPDDGALEKVDLDQVACQGDGEVHVYRPKLKSLAVDRRAWLLIHEALVHVDGQRSRREIYRIGALLMGKQADPVLTAKYTRSLPQSLKQALPILEATGGCSRTAQEAALESRSLASYQAAVGDAASRLSVDGLYDRTIAALMPERVRYDSLSKCGVQINNRLMGEIGKK